MKKVILLTGVTLITLSSCKNKELEELRLENEQLRNEKFQQSQTVYVWTVIECKVGNYTLDNGYGKEGFFNGTNNTLFWSDIEEVNVFNEDIKYKFQDELENKCRQRYGRALHSIQKKETFTFNSYTEASQFKDSVINGNKK